MNFIYNIATEMTPTCKIHQPHQVHSIDGFLFGCNPDRKLKELESRA